MKQSWKSHDYYDKQTSTDVHYTRVKDAFW